MGTLARWLLAQLPEYRHLLAVHADKIRMEERLHASESEREWLREQLATALREKDQAYRTMNNIAMQKAYGVKPYPDEIGIPESLMKVETPGPIASRFINGRDEVRIGNEAFWKDFEARKKRANASPSVASE